MWIDRAIDLCERAFGRVCVRGDTDFALTAHFDRWTDRGARFAFGIDAMPILKGIAETIEDSRWKPVRRRNKHTVKTKTRRRPENVKERIIKEREYKNIKLHSEHVAQFSYRPGKCNRDYRVVVLRKNLSVEQGERHLFDEVRYFFFFTNIADKSAAQIVQTGRRIVYRILTCNDWTRTFLRTFDRIRRLRLT